MNCDVEMKLYVDKQIHREIEILGLDSRLEVIN